MRLSNPVSIDRWVSVVGVDYARRVVRARLIVFWHWVGIVAVAVAGFSMVVGWVTAPSVVRAELFLFLFVLSIAFPLSYVPTFRLAGKIRDELNHRGAEIADTPPLNSPTKFSRWCDDQRLDRAWVAGVLGATQVEPNA